MSNTKTVFIFIAALLLSIDVIAKHEITTDSLTTITNVEIRRTTDGIPHIKANDWKGLGLGYGYAQAQDALCTLAEAFVTYEGKRSYFFGPEKMPAQNSTFGRPKNIDLDFFFRAFANNDIIGNYRKQQPAELNALIDGFADGYNRYLADAKTKVNSTKKRSCINEPWIRKISAEDLYRRIYAAGLAAGYARFITEIVNAKPNLENRLSDKNSLSELQKKLSYSIGDQPGLGSNMIAFGKVVTKEDNGILFGNPHWYWGGPDRLYQAHLTIPGRFNVAGASFLGMPVIMIGFNEHVAWTHTVSQARRFGLFELQLSSANRMAYHYDDRIENMQPMHITIDARGENGSMHQISRTLYKTRMGPVIDLGEQAKPFGWGDKSALVIHDINADNFRIFRLYFEWAQATSLDEFIALQKRELAVPWVNTVAIARNDGRVWYGDIGAVPNVSDTLRKNCGSLLSEAFSNVDPLTPVLDGSKSSCNWLSDSPDNKSIIQQGLMPVNKLPGLLRQDYVANMNDSYWLTSPYQPLEGFASLLGGEREPLSLRSQYGHYLAEKIAKENFYSVGKLISLIKKETLNPRAYSADLYKIPLLKAICRSKKITVAHDVLSGENYQPPKAVNISNACQVLYEWSNTGNSLDRGSLLWDSFWNRLERIPEATHYKKYFSADKPLEISREVDMDNSKIPEAFAAAVLAFDQRGVAINSSRGQYLYTKNGKKKIPLYGGCADVGYFTIACPDTESYLMDQNAHANSYLQIVSFSKETVSAYTLLAHGLDERATIDGDESIKRYAKKNWLQFPFQESEILRDPGLKTLILK